VKKGEELENLSAVRRVGQRLSAGGLVLSQNDSVSKWVYELFGENYCL